MAGTSLLTLIDDIATILDDVAVLSKVAAKKTSGVLGDDLALNAEQVTGVSADREIPVVLAVAKGSLINKAILVPSALLISSVAPFLISPLLMLGGGFLCFEGVEKIVEKFFHKKEHQPDIKKLTNPELPLDEMEKSKIKGAVTTDFILSAEIIVITLGGLAQVDFSTRLMVLVTISLLMTVGVYGLVAMIVKLDDLGIYFQKKNGFQQSLGNGLLVFAPLLMKGLGIAGTIAMFLVGGGILAHAIPFLHHFQQSLSGVMPTLFEGAVGVIAGGVVLVVVNIVKKLFKK